MTGECESHRRETDPDWVVSRDCAQPPQLASTVVKSEDGPPRRTIYPSDVDEISLMAQWLTADETDFVDLGEWR
jgi:hypothetical protein